MSRICSKKSWKPRFYELGSSKPTPTPLDGEARRLEGATPSQLNEEELRQQARLWQQHVRQKQAKQEAQQEAQASPGAPQAASLQPEAWGTLPEHVQAVIAANWDVIVEDAEKSVQDSARSQARVAAARQDVASAEALRDASQELVAPPEG